MGHQLPYGPKDRVLHKYYDYEEIVHLQRSSALAGNNYNRNHDQIVSGLYHQLSQGDHWHTEKERERGGKQYVSILILHLKLNLVTEYRFLFSQLLIDFNN